MSEDHPEKIFLWIAGVSLFWLVVGVGMLEGPRLAALFGVFLAMGAWLLILIAMFWDEMAQIERERQERAGPWFTLPKLYEDDEQ